ncbi:MAG: nucleoside-diphosphate kinase [Candidatus Diapherotrites archaeon]|nr:nucleoside-diphosphate kinase [Candidatus Diapherotrites archaeon]
MIEKTLVLIKPDGVQRALSGEIIKRFENVGLKIVGMKMAWIDEELGAKHYADVRVRKGDKVFNAVLKLITMGPVIAMVLEGIDAVEIVRKMCGPTEPKSALPGTIRGDYAHVSYAYSDTVGEAVRNVVHASGSKEEAKTEIDLWFNEKEIHDYPSVHDLHILHKKVELRKK